MATYLSLVNSVLRRLRENECNSVQDTAYTKLIGEFINETKREVEDAWDWRSLYRQITLTSQANVNTYTLTGTNNRTRIPEEDQYNTTNRFIMRPVDLAYINKMNLIAQQPKSNPYQFAVSGQNPNTNELIVTVFPTPQVDGIVMPFFVFGPQADLVNDTDNMLVPSQPVIDGAWARAISERGEDGGRMSDAQFGIYKSTLADYIAIAAERDGGIVWEPT